MQDRTSKEGTVSEGPEQTITPEPTAAEAAPSTDAAPAVEVVEAPPAAEVTQVTEVTETVAEVTEVTETVAEVTEVTEAVTDETEVVTVVEVSDVVAVTEVTELVTTTAVEAESAADPVEVVEVALVVETVSVGELAPVAEAAPVVEAAVAAEVTPAVEVAPAAEVEPAPAAVEAVQVVEVVQAVEVTGTWGRVTADGTVYLRTSDGEREIGSWAAGTPAEALAYYERKFDGLKVEVELLEKRIRTTDLAAKDAEAAIAKLREALADAHVMGDIAALLIRLGKLEEIAEQRRAQKKEARAKQLVQAAEHKERLVTESETLAESTDWKKTGDRLRALVDEWKGIARLDRKADDELWSRFSAARSTFAKRRKAHFAQLDAERDTARTRKEALAEEAVSLADSTDWAATAQRFRDLMTEWKKAGRAQRDVEDKLWERFKTAQDTFFGARNADLDQRDAGFRENAARKEELLIEAQKLIPVTDFKSARAALRNIQTRWEEVGPVPRDAKGRIEGALRDVERAVGEAEQHEWQRTNPEARARAEATVRQLETSIAKFEKEADKARTAGQQRKVDDAVAAIAARREWLAQAQAALEEFTR
jgi:hypothetical protein